jgi:hypothetical protein
MHVSPETMKTLAFVLLMLLVALYVHLAHAPRRPPRSLVDIGRHRRDDAQAGTGAEAGPGHREGDL